MLITKIVRVNITYKNKDRLKLLGYNIEDLSEIYIKTEDLSYHSGISVDVQCDYCGNIVVKKYYKYLQARKKFPKDSCVECIHKKQKEMRETLS